MSVATPVEGGWEPDLEDVPVAFDEEAAAPFDLDDVEIEVRPRSMAAIRCARHRARMAAAMVEWRSGTCEQCDTRDRPREMAHLTATGLMGRGRGIHKRYYDIRNNPDCYARLCWPCHREYDKPGRGRLVRSQLPFATDPPPWAARGES